MQMNCYFKVDKTIIVRIDTLLTWAYILKIFEIQYDLGGQDSLD